MFSVFICLLLVIQKNSLTLVMRSVFLILYVRSIVAYFFVFNKIHMNIGKYNRVLVCQPCILNSIVALDVMVVVSAVFFRHFQPIISGKDYSLERNFSYIIRFYKK